MATRVFGVTVCKNELDRYMQSCLAWTRQFVDRIFVYDDQSEDGSIELAREFADVVVRPDSVPTFLDHEGEFRQAGWDAFVEVCAPVEGDFVLAFDLDEFWYGPNLHGLADFWDYEFTGGIVKRPEMWSINDPEVRVDDLWKTIENIRFWPFKPDGQFKMLPLAGGSHPLSAQVKTKKIEGNLLHYGYATPEDRQIRFDRYIVRGGHNPRHIRSILGEPAFLKKLDEYWGPIPPVWRGVR